MPFKKGFKTSYNSDPNKYDTWATPQWLFDELNEQFHFDIDVCASKKNAKCRTYYSKKEDGLKQQWKGACFCNPPYGSRVIDKWMKKALESSIEGATVVCLVPSNTSTKWWHNYAMKGEVWFIKGKVKFIKNGKEEGPAGFHSAIVVFRGKKKNRKDVA